MRTVRIYCRLRDLNNGIEFSAPFVIQCETCHAGALRFAKKALSPICAAYFAIVASKYEYLGIEEITEDKLCENENVRFADW